MIAQVSSSPFINRDAGVVESHSAPLLSCAWTGQELYAQDPTLGDETREGMEQFLGREDMGK